jgi:hypothetical protein
MKRSTSALLFLAMTAAACAGAPSSAPKGPPRSFPAPSPTWAGPGSFGEDGTVEIDTFNAYVKETRAGWAQSPIRMALEFLAVGDPSDADGGALITTAEQRASPEEGTEASVVVTMEGLHDDSVEAVRYTLAFRKEGHGWRLLSAAWSQRCAEKRGHQDFSVELCV